MDSRDLYYRVCVTVFLLQLADVKSLPGVRELVRLRPREGEHHLALVHWILSSKSFAVKTLQKDEVRASSCEHDHESLSSKVLLCLQFVSVHLCQYANLCDLTENQGITAPVPDFLFELEYCDQMNARFEKTRGERDVFYAFHGSRLENFHSIVHNGLHCHLNKVSATVTSLQIRDVLLFLFN